MFPQDYNSQIDRQKGRQADTQASILQLGNQALAFWASSFNLRLALIQFLAGLLPARVCVCVLRSLSIVVVNYSCSTALVEELWVAAAAAFAFS